MKLAARRVLSDLNVAVAGQGGDGSLTVVTLLGMLLARRGFHLYTARNVASRIKGGHAAAMMRGSTSSRGCMGDHFDVLVAFDDEAIEKAGHRVAPNGIVIFDGSAGPPPPGILPDSAQVIEIPFARMAVRDLRRDLFKNSLGFGVLTRVLGAGDDEAEDCLTARFRHLPAITREANLEALRRGFALAAEHGLDGGGPWVLDRTEPSDRLLISGNEALAMGFLAAGGRVFTGYPITPASEILSFLERELPRFGGTAVQAEDELAAINMAAGAALAGARAMTATSGPGISLMQEGVSHLGSAEIPLVIVDCQRAGPSTGMPTKPEQSDLTMVVHGGNGDFPMVALAPGDPTDCFELSVAATNLAQRLQGPVYLVLDQAVAQDSMTVPTFDLGAVAVERGKRLDAGEIEKLAEYRRYLITEDGISPWSVPGTQHGMSLVTGNERNEWGLVTTEPGNRTAMIDKRLRKVTALRSELPGARRWGTADAAVGLLGIGMQAGVMRDAADRLAADGLEVSCLQPRTLWPVPEETVAFVNQRRTTYVIEHNAQGQLAELLRVAGADRMESILRYDGVPFAPGGLAGEILAREKPR